MYLTFYVVTDNIETKFHGNKVDLFLGQMSCLILYISRNLLKLFSSSYNEIKFISLENLTLKIEKWVEIV